MPGTYEMPAADLLYTPADLRGVRLFGDGDTVAAILHVTFNNDAVIVCTEVTGPAVDGRDIPEVGAAVLAEFKPAWLDHWQRGGPVVLAFRPGQVITADTPASR